MSQIEELTERCNKMSFLLGMAASALLNLKNDMFISAELRSRLEPFVEKFVSEIDELFYSSTASETKFQEKTPVVCNTCGGGHNTENHFKDGYQYLYPPINCS